MTRQQTEVGSLENILGKGYDIVVKAKKLYPDARILEYAHVGDAGADLFSYKDYIIEPGKQAFVSTGVSVAIPYGYEGQVRPRSGLAKNHMIAITNAPGTVDSGYRGEMNVILINHGDKSYEVKKGDRIAQIVFKKVEVAKIVEVENLDDTTRGDGGFGSTGYR